MDAMHRLVRRVTVSLQVARVALGTQNHCSGRSICRVIWRGIEPRLLDCRVDGDDSRPLQNGVIFRSVSTDGVVHTGGMVLWMRNHALPEAGGYRVRCQAAEDEQYPTTLRP